MTSRVDTFDAKIKAVEARQDQTPGK